LRMNLAYGKATTQYRLGNLGGVLGELESYRNEL